MPKPIADLIEDLKNDDISNHDIVEIQLLAYGTDAVAPLIEAVCLERKLSCWRIIKAIAKFDDPRCIPVLQNIIIASNTVFAQTAVQGLERYGKQGVEPLLDLLIGDETMQQTYIVSALGRLRDRRAVQPLIDCLLQSKWSVLQYTTIEALGILGDKSAIDVIRMYVDDDNHHVRDHSKEALQRLNSTE